MDLCPELPVTSCAAVSEAPCPPSHTPSHILAACPCWGDKWSEVQSCQPAASQSTLSRLHQLYALAGGEPRRLHRQEKGGNRNFPSKFWWPSKVQRPLAIIGPFHPQVKDCLGIAPCRCARQRTAGASAQAWPTHHMCVQTLPQPHRSRSLPSSTGVHSQSSGPCKSVLGH